jgi:hypothetical protein
LKGRDKRQNENDFVISAERPSEIEKPERNCGLFHMEKELISGKDHKDAYKLADL